MRGGLSSMPMMAMTTGTMAAALALTFLSKDAVLDRGGAFTLAIDKNKVFRQPARRLDGLGRTDDARQAIRDDGLGRGMIAHGTLQRRVLILGRFGRREVRQR